MAVHPIRGAVRHAKDAWCIIEGKSYGAAGSMGEFSWSYLNNVQRWIIEFGLDAGFSERNNMGFGFMNLIRD